MPDMLAHSEVAEAARLRLPRGPLADVLLTEHPAYRVGAQGPDFFFYSHVWPGSRSRGDLAFLVHRHKMGEVFRTMLAAAAEAPPAERRVLTAWTCGYAAHLCADATAHPWILYWTGDVTGRDAAARRRHGTLEASIDVTLRRRRSDDPAWIRRQRLLDLPDRPRDIVAELWERIMRDVYGVAFTAAEGRAALRDMARVYGSMTDRRSPLSRTLRAMAPAIDRDGLMRTQLYPGRPHRAAAALFSTRRPWCYPSIPDEPRTETLSELLRSAVGQAVVCLEAIGAALSGSLTGGAGQAAGRSGGVSAGDLEAALAVIGERDMITGVPCEDPRPLVAFAPGLEQAWGLG